jgi:RNA polymerase sigma-70 factor, ECF subfamily
MEREQRPFAEVVLVEMSPSQSAGVALSAGVVPAPDAAFLNEFWHMSDAATYGLTRPEFDEILLRFGATQNFGLPTDAAISAAQQAEFFRALKLNDVVMARACAAGNERAWEHFVAIYHEPLARSAIAITGSETLGRELAGSLYAELYGMKDSDGQRKCPLDSYRGRGSLMGWLRTTLAQRFVDHHRRSHRETALDDPEHGFDPPAPASEEPPVHLAALAEALEHAVTRASAEDRFLIAAYYLDGRTLAQIARLLRVHEATVSRKLRRAIEEIRMQVLRNLRQAGLSRRAAAEALGADPRDLDVRWKKLLQYSQANAFQEKAER